ncbi:MAG: glutamate--tRNA ligase [Clostridiales bacterium]|nr:glutamate--tRNA ligase [Clostridiales bacterium]
MNHQQLAALLFPDVTESREDVEARFPKRDLPEGAKVTRIGPSPTGFIHLGNLYNAIIAERLAHQSGGVFYLRIEDTDQKREVPGAVETILRSMAYFGVYFDEGATIDGNKGDYGPYRQRQRAGIYHVFAKWLVEQGMAYPCFCTAEQLDVTRERQQANKELTGYYGPYATCRNLSLEEVQANLEAGKPWVLRFRAPEEQGTILVNDAIRGALKMPSNNMDFVLLKSDGIPTYHFAHCIDDHLMQSTYVIRGEEWLASLPMHVALFEAMGWEPPIFCHTATLMKLDTVPDDNGGEKQIKRKLSKRKDPELALAYYQQEGICQDAVWEFLLTLLNSNYEEWRIANPEASYLEFPYTLEKMSNSGALVDLEKLDNISKDVICRMPAEEVYKKWSAWCKEYNPDFYALLTDYKDKTLKALNVGKGGKKPRKDLVSWKQACQFMSFYYDETFQREDEFPEQVDEATRKEFFRRYLESNDFSADQSAWFANVKAITGDMGFAVRPKDYKKHPEDYKGSIVHTTNMLRIALTGRANAPDIWEVSNVLGEDCVRARIEKWL